MQRRTGHPTLKKYEEQEKILNGRSSYSKTDTDATFMRMKEDHMLNGQLKPGYNLQVSSNNQDIVNYLLHGTTADNTTLQQHTELYRGVQCHTRSDYSRCRLWI